MMMEKDHPCLYHRDSNPEDSFHYNKKSRWQHSIINQADRGTNKTYSVTTQTELW